MCVNNLPKVDIWQRNSRELLNSPHLESQANALTITPPGHNGDHIFQQISTKSDVHIKFSNADFVFNDKWNRK